LASLRRIPFRFTMLTIVDSLEIPSHTGMS